MKLLLLYLWIMPPQSLRNYEVVVFKPWQGD